MIHIANDYELSPTVAERVKQEPAQELTSDPLLIRLLKIVPNDSDTLNAEDARAAYAFTLEEWQSFKARGWLVEFYREGTGETVFKREHLANLKELVA